MLYSLLCTLTVECIDTEVVTEVVVILVSKLGPLSKGISINVKKTTVCDDVLFTRG